MGLESRKETSMGERSHEDLVIHQEGDAQGSAVIGTTRKKLHSRDSCILTLSPAAVPVLGTRSGV